eukprot:scaffold110674_cov118-Phaeocystis_antarctica.AAC.2
MGDLQPVDGVLTGTVPVDVLVRRLTGVAAVVGHHETHANSLGDCPAEALGELLVEHEAEPAQNIPVGHADSSTQRHDAEAD